MFTPTHGLAQEIAPNLRRIVAPNPSPMTHTGTNTYLLGYNALAVIDPGPVMPEHLNAILKAAGRSPITHIFVTHSHLDHSPLARPLSMATGAPVYAFGDSGTGRSALMQDLAAQGVAGGGEGIDPNFAPDVLLTDGEQIESTDWTLTALHTPGHMGNHLAFQWNEDVFTGDLVMDWASSLVSPPDGDLSDFLTSCERLLDLNPKRLFSGHGDVIQDGPARIQWLIDHRQDRTAQIIAALQSGPSDIPTLAKSMYVDAPEGLLKAAARNVFAHLVDLHSKGKVSAAPALHPDASYSLT